MLGGGFITSEEINKLKLEKNMLEKKIKPNRIIKDDYTTYILLKNDRDVDLRMMECENRNDFFYSERSRKGYVLIEYEIRWNATDSSLRIYNATSDLLKLDRESRVKLYNKVKGKKGNFMNKIQDIDLYQSPHNANYKSKNFVNTNNILLTESDYEIFNNVFVSLPLVCTCPICLTTNEKDPTECRYAFHKCNESDLVTPIQKFLYNKFSKDGTVYWCAACNRICQNHAHFIKSTLNDTLKDANLPEYESELETDVYSLDCPYGNFEEKIARYENILRQFAIIQKSKANVSSLDAKNRLVGAFWDGPLVISKEVSQLVIKNKKFFTPIELFKRTILDVSTSNKNIGTAEFLPEKVESPNNYCEIDSGIHDDNRPTWRFKHRKFDGTINVHLDNELICGDDFADYLLSIADQGKNKCFLSSGCSALIHPDELKTVIGKEDERYVRYLEFYKNKFGVQQGGNIMSIFANGPKFQTSCALPRRRGGKRITRKAKKSNRKTNRKHK